ncbi:receptor protein kinase-like protein [Tripterygium wilfordii]|uniref:Receptor protein kinase-like protein n=1 Tax=Tripterygium wilfordii TaxID=458696 RepID=A0A7J7DXR8_TRIWF|nr:receptor protein kinase-like protein At4g34220 [Tripterygium wilfordii]KAF5751178.1 receptor protein kinase-like protein [Tripterygium wilfordii]
MRVDRIAINFCPFLLLLFLLVPSLALNTDGVLLLSFKYSILGDPLSVLQSWNYDDKTPCSWNGVTCTEMGNPGSPDMFRVTSLVLPDSQLLGSIPINLGYIEHLQNLDLSNNSLNGSLPNSIFNNTELKVLSLSGNNISGELPEYIGTSRSLQVLNLSYNAMAGKIPENLTNLQNLTVVSLKNNQFTGTVPSGFSFVEVLDLSSNLLNGPLNLNFKGESLRYLNLSNNMITGSISNEFAKGIPENATIDLSFNNLTGAIPEYVSLLNQKTESFTGNVELCGKPLKNLCSVPSTLSTPPNVTTTSPAIAVIPRTFDSNPSSDSLGTPNSTQNQAQISLKPATIVGIVMADLAGLAVLALVILYVYQLKKRKHSQQNHDNPLKAEKLTDIVVVAKSDSRKSKACSCLNGEETSESATSDSDHDEPNRVVVDLHQNETEHKGGTLVTVDGETNLEVETLLKASAYILGASGVSILYKAVLEDGTAFAVRRIGENRLERLKDFEHQVRSIAKLRHPNLVRVRGFYWGDDEKLVIYDYVSNGSLATTSSRKVGSSPYHLPLEVRFRIARGVARGLAYIHEKKHVHGNIKPNNILFNSGMEPMIADFGLDRLVSANSSFKASNSARNLGGQDNACSPGSSMSSNTSPYQSPESLKNLKPNPKWDVYSFGMILLELLTGRVLSDRELEHHWSVMEEGKNRVLRMADVAIRDDVERSEEAMLACFRLGFSCVSFLAQKRPTMKEAFHILEKISPSTRSSG